MTDWWRERRQNEQLEDLQSEMSYARQETSRLQSQLSRVQGGLQDRVERLTTAFDAFVELSDIRHETAGFVNAAELRRYASRVLTAMASSTELPTAGEPVAGYWLGPATDALIALHADKPDEQALSTAMGLDERRTSTFLVLALAALGQRHKVRSEWLDVAFGVPAADGTVTRVQRVLWTTAARGGVGMDGLELVVKRLQSVTSADGAWLSRLELRGNAPARPRGQYLKAIEEQNNASVRLSKIRDAIESIAGNTEAREPDPSLSYPEERKTDRTPSSAARRATNESGRGSATADEPPKDSAAGMLRLLISEGSEPERETLARIAVLRGQITGTGGKAETLDDPAGAVQAHLTDDLNVSADPHLSIAALRVVGPLVLPAVETLAEVAVRPGPAELTIESGTHTITVRPDGPDQLELSKAQTALTAAADVTTAAQRVLPIAIMGVGALVAIGLGFVHWFWIVVGLVVIGIGANRYWSLRSAISRDKESAAGEVTSLNERSAAAAGELSAYLAGADARQATITTDLTAIRQHLTA
ncbi:hypothetical protein OHA18_01415 [Kribbella sp. NBC_00709]|uniref:hypothetical protein n=1 Tax=Kribbella sp. NBC_00709 TaxID=2975972 RepID=UPI002E27BD85|nr:hypothetical protein [Kribbella sp. NBC_00709]